MTTTPDPAADYGYVRLGDLNLKPDPDFGGVTASLACGPIELNRVMVGGRGRFLVGDPTAENPATVTRRHIDGGWAANPDALVLPAELTVVRGGEKVAVTLGRCTVQEFVLYVWDVYAARVSFARAMDPDNYAIDEVQEPNGA